MSNKRMAAVQLGYHSLFCLSEDKQHIVLLVLGIFHVIYFPGARPTPTATILIYLFACDFKSENGMSSTEVSPTTASAAELPLMPTWPGTQIKTISFPSLVKSIYSSRICTKTGCSYFRLNNAFSDESESDSIKKDFVLEPKE